MFAYYQQFVHIDNFTGLSLQELHHNLTTKSGLKCTDSTQQWSIQVANAASQLNYYVYFVTQKTLTITDGNVMVSVESD